MRKITLRIGFIAALSAALMVGCNKEDSTSEAYPDSYVHSIMMEGVPVYATIHTVSSYSQMQKVVLSGPVGTMELPKVGDTGLTFTYSPDDNEYESSVPSGGTYNYQVDFTNGQQNVYSNSVTPPFVQPSTDLAVTVATENNVESVKLVWGKVANSDYYVINVTQGTTTIYSLSGTVPTANTMGEYKFPLSGFSAYRPGIVKFEVIAVDEEGNSSGYINSLSTANINYTFD